MNFVLIDDKKLEFEEKETVLDVARKNNIDIPTLCYLKDCSNIGQCGVCLVEVEGQDKLARACAMKVKPNMKILTNSEKVIKERQNVISELLSKHEFKCGPCGRRENCEFLKLVIKTKAKAKKVFKVENKNDYIDDRSKALSFDRSKCIVCGRCVAACRKNTKLNAIKFHKIDGVRRVGAQDLKCFDDTDCVLCGQCVIACPVDALKEKSHIDRVKCALEDEDKHVIVAMAPAVRSSIGELFKMPYGTDVTGRLYTALKLLGFEKVFDINFGADMTVMEEAREFIHRLDNNINLPMFTSCCPSWIRYVENFEQGLKRNLSTAKSPQQIFGIASKSYYPQVENLNPKNIFTVTVMPCTSKKYEADKEDFEFAGNREIDAVITTRELATLFKAKKIKFSELEDSNADKLMGRYSGAGVLFGSTGGVMEATLRTAQHLKGVESVKLEYKEFRGLENIKEAVVKFADKEVKVAVIHGIANVAKFLENKVKLKEYDFIEVMACDGGCVNGGGQPHISAEMRSSIDVKTLRRSVLQKQDSDSMIRRSDENIEIKDFYENFIGKKGDCKAHELLHYSYK
ncbi:MAG: [FeFe] hydrogenase, group A [Sarcina sp.]